GERMGLTVGPAAPGDRLVLPETHGGGRSIKRLCMDRRISLSERDRLPAVYAGGCLAAVWRLGVGMAFAAPEGEPCRFIQITEAAKERDLI
ncbi:MAG: tRNA lysidine(34) synthetase TilS, partial [Dysosmobacter sp.]|nr:tRNA lysidine(34) synthetase TilS [Dysosmobacter sp.]